MGEKAGMELRRLKKVALKAGLTVSHHCPMRGMYKILGEVRLASTKTCRQRKVHAQWKGAITQSINSFLKFWCSIKHFDLCFLCYLCLAYLQIIKRKNIIGLSFTYSPEHRFLQVYMHWLQKAQPYPECTQWIFPERAEQQGPGGSFDPSRVVLPTEVWAGMTSAGWLHS